MTEQLTQIRDKVVAYRKACNDDLTRRWDDTDHGGRLACDYVLQEIDAQLRRECPHWEMSHTGVDQMWGADKVWRCDNCGQTGTSDALGPRPEEEQP